MIQFKNQHAAVFGSALFRTTSTVIQTDDLVLAVDPNWLPAEVMGIRQYVDSIRKEKPLYLLFTHSDYDHIIGYRAFPGAKVIASEAFVDNPEKDTIVEQILNWDDEYYISRDYPIEYPRIDVTVQQDGQIVQIGDTKLTFYLAPGHNRDGIFSIVEFPVNKQQITNNHRQTAIWLAGDYLSNVEFPYLYYGSSEYEKTLAKVDGILSRHKFDLLVPGHGDVATTEEEILTRKKESFDYIHALRQSLIEGKEFELEKLWQRYRFPRGMKKFHEENVKLISRELQSNLITL